MILPEALKGFALKGGDERRAGRKSTASSINGWTAVFERKIQGLPGSFT
jgi:hypothetical protein